jgi:hypothetical protein
MFKLKLIQLLKTKNGILILKFLKIKLKSNDFILKLFLLLPVIFQKSIHNILYIFI